MRFSFLKKQMRLVYQAIDLKLGTVSPFLEERVGYKVAKPNN